ncbi:MAG TPA: transglutaminase family protein [Beijerinckiaceae bacterium]|jgi:transglutaminase-like putative cysteine protease|nr:transglutaminase family protein [Beijerinckiaceae bacterium]
MLIRVGFDIAYSCPQPVATVLKLGIEHGRTPDLTEPDRLIVEPYAPLREFTDSFGNRCVRLVSPAGVTRLKTSAFVRDSGLPDVVRPDAREVPVQELPTDVLRYLVGSRYCEVDKLGSFAWAQFGTVKPGWTRVQAIFDFVHNHLEFGYPHARATRSAAESLEERLGVCRDFTHLSIALLRAMNIPARYCNGYLGDIGVPPDPAPMDFNAWTEVYLDGHWYTFDARHNMPRIGRIVVARGLDAADIPMIHTFGPHWLQEFTVMTDEVAEESQAAQARAA